MERRGDKEDKKTNGRITGDGGGGERERQESREREKGRKRKRDRQTKTEIVPTTYEYLRRDFVMR